MCLIIIYYIKKIFLNFEVGEILVIFDLMLYIVLGYDLYIYVNDGKILVGFCILIVIILGSKY